MKKQIFYFATAVLAAGLTACSSDELEDESVAKLADNQLLAIAPSAPETRMDIEKGTGESSSKYLLNWHNGDAFGVFSDDDANENAKFTLTSTDAESGKGTFTTSTPVTNPKYAYYPYEEVESKNIKLTGKLAVNLKSTSEYKEGQIEIPMFGTITSKKVTFSPLTAVLKVTVLNMPANIDQVVLSSYGNNGTDGEPLSGAATINGITGATQTLTVDGEKGTNNTITYTFSAPEKGSEMTFYFAIPSASSTGLKYEDLVFSLGSTFDVTKDDPTDASIKAKVYSKTLTAVTGKIYATTLRYTDDETIEEAAVQTLNNALAGITSSTSEAIEQSFEGISTNPVIILPTVATEDEISGSFPDEVEIKLTDITDLTVDKESVAPTITIKQDKTTGYAPKSIKITASKKDENTAGLNLDIQLPNSSVTLSPAVGSTITYTTVTSQTAKGTLNVDDGTTITKLTLKSGYVMLKHSTSSGVVTEAVKDASYEGNAYIFYEAEEAPTIKNTAKDITIANKSICNLLTGKGDAELSAAFELKDPVIVKEDASIDLKGANNLTIVDGGSITVTKGGELTINNTTSSEGKVTSALAAATITVEEGGKLVLGAYNKVTIENTNETSAVAVSASNGTVTLTNADITGDVNLVKSSATTASLASTLKTGAIKGNVNVKDGATLAEDDSASNLSITGDLTVSGKATASLKVTTITGKAVVDGASGTKLTLAGGSIVVAEESEETAVTVKGGATVEVTGAATITGEKYAFDVENGNVNVSSAAAITGTTAAVNVVKGKLDVSGDATLTSDNIVINAVPEKEDDAEIILAGEGSKFTSNAGRKGYVLYNANAAGNAPAAYIEISDGSFSGDIKSDAAEYFIFGGKFKNCDNLYKNRETYINYGYQFGSTDTDNFMEVEAKSSSKSE